MSFFKKLFGSEDKPTPESTKILADNSQSVEIKVELSSVYKVTGLDEEFINIIYFPNDQIKQKHRDDVNSALSKLGIKPGDEFSKVQQKLTDYNNIELDEPIPFLIESILVEQFDIKNDSNGVTETKSTRGWRGADKIHDYYSASSFISENIALKLNSEQSDFSFEENLYVKYIANSDLNNFAKLNSTFYLGFAFLKVNNISKAEHYLNLLENGPFNIQPSTIADFYRNIGELYAEKGDKVKALKWLKAGLILNSKLGVKKLIAKLEGG